MSLTLASPLTALRGVGPAGARTLRGAGLETVGDLLWLVPYRYEDRSNPLPIVSLTTPDVTVTVVGRLTHLVDRQARRRRLRVTEAVIDDGTGALAIVWFNQPYLRGSFHVGDRLWLHGTVRVGRSNWGLQLVAPEWEVEDEDEDPVHLGRVVPVYRRIGSLSGRRLRSLTWRALAALEGIDDPLVHLLPRDLCLPPLGEALRHVHFPVQPGVESGTTASLAELVDARAPARRRLAFEELLTLAVVLEGHRLRRRAQHAVRCQIGEGAREMARAVLPFRLTTAQRRVLSEIVADLQRPYPMARLLQGDVGSGKTIVAALSALVMLESTSQVALLAPTELLAQQHFATFRRLLAGTPHQPLLLIGSMSAREKRDVREHLAHLPTALVIGTHALLEDEVVFSRLGLVIIDEQHRFGAAQRQAMVDKGDAPHLLVMTATPIPRSIALSLYGDLDVSLLDELPPGRTPIRTALRDEGARRALCEFVQREVGEGGQAYWVFPLIEESEKLSVRAVESHVRAVRSDLLGVRVGVVHGRLPAAERESVMAAFVAGEIQVLCATTVIEVGVDVPNASVMVVENAERFGLAQLHQLRGRVGRGRRRSFCVLLVGEGHTEEALERLRLFAGTSDGFRIAEEDFRLRGPGEFTGLRQWGRPEFRVASLLLHRDELEAARSVAAAVAARGGLAELAATLRAGSVVGGKVATG